MYKIITDSDEIVYGYHQVPDHIIDFIKKTEIGLHDGDYTIYNTKNVKICELTIKHGMMNGLYTHNHKNGNKWLSIEFLHNKLHGTSKTYNKTKKAVLISETHYTHHVPSGTHTQYHNNGLPKYAYQYSDTGDMVSDKCYDKNGYILREINYKKGQLNGMMTKYLDSNNLNYTVPYLNGLKHGLEQRYLYGNKKYVEYNWSNGIQNGPCVKYQSDGQTKLSKCIMVNGKRVGALIKYPLIDV
jgi:antitoxin component YwqK of YwqJK toxin-antitoxin module